MKQNKTKPKRTSEMISCHSLSSVPAANCRFASWSCVRHASREARDKADGKGNDKNSSDSHCSCDPRPRSTVSAWPLSLMARPPITGGLFTYSLPPNVFASGILRFGGVALGVGLTGVVVGSTLIHAATGQELGSLITSVGRCVPPQLVWAAKLCVGFPLLGHLLGGVRDIGWHLGVQSLEKDYCRSTSLAIIFLSLTSSCALAVTRIPFKSKVQGKFMSDQ